MIRRLLSTLPARVALAGGLGALVLLVGALAGSWRVAAAGLALALVAVLALGVLVARSVQTVRRGGGAGGPVAGTAGGGLADELALATAVEAALERGDLDRRVDEAVRRRALVERAELAATHHLERYDTTPPVPVPTTLSAAQAHAVVAAVESASAATVLAIGTDVATLWAAAPLRTAGARADVVVDAADAAAVTALVAERGADDVLRVRGVERAVPDAPYAVHPWFVLPDGEPADLVVVAAATAREARAALPALPLLLDRLAPAGRIVVVEDPDHAVLGPAWSAAPSVEPDPTGGPAGVVLRRAGGGAP